MGGALPARRNVRALPDRVASPAAAKLRGGVAPAPVREGSFPNITEVMVNGPDDVFVEREGRIERVRDRLFEGEEPVMHLMGWVGRVAWRGRFVDRGASCSAKTA